MKTDLIKRNFSIIKVIGAYIYYQKLEVRLKRGLQNITTDPKFFIFYCGPSEIVNEPLVSMGNIWGILQKCLFKHVQFLIQIILGYFCNIA